MGEVILQLLRTVFLPNDSPPIYAVNNIKVDIREQQIRSDGGKTFCQGEADILIDYLSLEQGGESGAFFREAHGLYPAHSGSPWQAMLFLPFDLLIEGELDCPPMWNLSVLDFQWLVVAPRALEMDFQLSLKGPDKQSHSCPAPAAQPWAQAAESREAEERIRPGQSWAEADESGLEQPKEPLPPPAPGWQTQPFIAQNETRDKVSWHYSLPDPATIPGPPQASRLNEEELSRIPGRESVRDQASQDEGSQEYNEMAEANQPSKEEIMNTNQDQNEILTEKLLHGDLEEIETPLKNDEADFLEEAVPVSERKPFQPIEPLTQPPLFTPPPAFKNQPSPEAPTQPPVDSIPITPEPKPVIPKPVIPEPKPVIPEPKPIIPEPEPVIPEPELIIPEPEPVIPEPKPITPEPKPVIPEPEPIIPEPEPIIPEPEPIIPEPIPEIKEEVEPQITIEPQVVMEQECPMAIEQEEIKEELNQRMQEREMQQELREDSDRLLMRERVQPKLAKPCEESIQVEPQIAADIARRKKHSMSFCRVMPGETAISLALRLGVPVDLLLAKNQLEGQEIVPGMVLRVPKV